MNRKGQSMMVMIIFVILIFIGLAIFLLSFAGTLKQTEYQNLYVHNLLLSIMRTDTQYTDPNCKTVADTVACVFTQTSEYRCGGSGEKCLGLANDTLNDYMGRFELVKKNFRYLFVVKPESGTIQQKITIGDSSLETARIDKLKAIYLIPRFLATGQYNIKVELYLAEK